MNIATPPPAVSKRPAQRSPPFIASIRYVGEGYVVVEKCRIEYRRPRNAMVCFDEALAIAPRRVEAQPAPPAEPYSYE